MLICFRVLTRAVNGGLTFEPFRNRNGSESDRNELLNCLPRRGVMHRIKRSRPENEIIEPNGGFKKSYGLTRLPFHEMTQLLRGNNFTFLTSELQKRFSYYLNPGTQSDKKRDRKEMGRRY